MMKTKMRKKGKKLQM